MNTEPWFILTYETADQSSQQSLTIQLQTLGGLKVRPDDSDGRFVVVIESFRPLSAVALHELVMGFDATAELVSSQKLRATEHEGFGTVPQPA